MTQKIYHDIANNKQVHDLSGVKDEAQVIANFGLAVGTVVTEIDETFEAVEVINGVPTKFDAKQRGLDQAAARQADAQGKQTAALAKLNAGRTGPPLTVEDLDDLSG